jgi:hypothetical protein
LTYSVDVAQIDDIADPPFVVFNVGVAVDVSVVAVLLTIGVEIVLQFSEVGPGWELETVGVDQRWVVPSFQRNFPVEGLDFAETVGKTFQVVPGQDLLVHVVEKFAAVVCFQIEFFTAHPEGIVQVVVIVERVDTDVFSEVGQRLFRVQIEVVPRIVGEDDSVVVVSATLSVVQLFVVLRLLDNFSIVEVVRVDFVNWGQGVVVSVRTVYQSNREGVKEHSFADVVPGPHGGLVEGFPVVGIVEQLEQSNGWFQVFLGESREDFSPLESLAITPVVVELFDNFRFLNRHR